MAPAYASVERRLGIVEGRLQERHHRLARALGVHIVPKRAPLVGQRIWTAQDTRAASSAMTSTPAIELIHANGRALAVRAMRAGKVIDLEARGFVLAASAVETARLLLRSGVDDRVGRRFVDHAVVSAVLWARDPPARSSGPLDDSALIPNVVNEGRGTKRSYRGGFSIEVVGPLRSAAAGICAPADARSATMIHAIGEMFPARGRFVALGKKRDRAGRRDVVVHAGLTTEDRALLRDMQRACLRVADALASPRSEASLLDRIPGGHGAGTCAMSRGNAVVDAFGRMDALGNVWIADSSVMPTAGDRHPTLTILAHGERVARDLIRRLAR